MRFLDTNILLYSISRDPAELPKRERAIALIEETGNALSVQVLQEFYVQATRPTRTDALSHDLAVGLMRTWLRFPVQEITLAVMSGALGLKASFGLSYWDAAIVAAAEAMGCDEIASEDMTHGQTIGRVTIRNPF
jgi:predicted nucleic acid-binding protein